MNGFRVFLAIIWAWLLSFFHKPYRLVVIEGEFPKSLHEKTLYVLTEDGDPWEARMICPCGCGDKLDLNLLTDQRPAWRAWTTDRNLANLHPSVWRHVGCKSHFILKSGAIAWCNPD